MTGPAERNCRLAWMIGITLCAVTLGASCHSGKSRERITQESLTALVAVLEHYRAGRGEYPVNLRDLIRERGDTGLNLLDGMGENLSGAEPVLFYYERINGGKNYLLFSRGRDGIPFTPDDIHPEIDPRLAARTGYRNK